jgi:hypothetical protein
VRSKSCPLSEKDLVGVLQKHLGVLGVDVAWAGEFRSHGRARTDLAILADSDIVAVEAKLHDWHRAIAQASLNRLWFDRSYVALWFDAISPRVEEEARKYGIGLLAVSLDSVVIHRRAPRTRPRAFLRNHMLGRLKEALG